MVLLKLSPVVLLAGMLLYGMDILLAAPSATLLAAVLAMTVDGKKYDEVLTAALDNAKQLVIILYVLMVSFAMAEVFMASGVGASIILLAMKAGLTAASVASASLLVTAALSVATGTSWGTFAACVPVLLWLSHIVGGNPILTVAAVAGGSCFGDNIGLISDTTVLSCGIHNVDVMDRIRHQGAWSLICLFAGAILFYVMSVATTAGTEVASPAAAIDAIPPEVWETLAQKRASAVKLLEQVRAGVPLYMLVPLIVVVVLAVKGVSTIPCLVVGIGSALICGMAAGTLRLDAFASLVQAGFSDAGAWSVAMTLWTGAFGGIMRLMNAFEPVSRAVLSVARNTRQLIFSNGIICLLCNAVLGDCTGQIVTVGPMLKDMTEKHVKATPEQMYRLRLRNATMSDAFGVLGSQLIPWHGYMIFFTGMAMAVYPLYEFKPQSIIAHNYYCIIAVVSMMILTYTGLDRLIPGFSIPSEPDVRLER